ncbi:DMT family transporter [Porphyromonadaceae bacterium OttesenSCG-928-L07]|nr:DMT family transporter [Porphyromonadaceae bacterium OttesenSCG-928-L07]MDL2330980.1 DMT family transporter [Odoribacter sp. OttesenSCG-928-A06]
MTKEKWQGHIAVLSTNVIFGLNTPISKSILMEWISPFALTLLRMVIASIVFWIIGLFFEKEKVRKQDMFILFLGALFGLAGSQISFATGLQNTSPVSLSLITSMTPVVVMLLAALWLKEPITGKKTLGVLLGIAGAIMIISGSYNMRVGMENRTLGNLMGIVNIVSYGIYLVIIRPVSQRYSPLTLMKWMFLFSVPLSFPFGINDLFTARVFTPEAGWDVWARLAFVVVIATVVAYFFVPIGLKRIRPTTVSMYSNIQPIVASTVAIVVGQDIFSWDKLLAAVLVLCGVYLVTQSKSKVDIVKKNR